MNKRPKSKGFSGVEKNGGTAELRVGFKHTRALQVHLRFLLFLYLSLEASKKSFPGCHDFCLSFFKVMRNYCALVTVECQGGHVVSGRSPLLVSAYAVAEPSKISSQPLDASTGPIGSFLPLDQKAQRQERENGQGPPQVWGLEER